jgi:putative FmdB family regulatory protein
MPNYEYKCVECGRSVTISRTIKERDYEVACTDPCSGVEMIRTIAAPGISFKGSGFHRNDYRKGK